MGITLCTFKLILTSEGVGAALKGITSTPLIIKVYMRASSCIGSGSAGCFAFVDLQMYCYYKCSVALPYGVIGWSAVCDCGISLSYSLTFL